MTLLGAAFAIAIVAAALAKRGVLHILMLSAAFPTSVAISFGSNGLPLFYWTAILGLAVTLAVRAVPARGAGPRPGRAALVLFAGWSALITAIAPALFAGIAVLAPRGGTDNEVADPSVLGYSTSNAAQVLYVVVAVAIVAYIGTRQTDPMGALRFALLAAVGLNLFRYAAREAGIAWPVEVFDTAVAVRYIDVSFGGGARFRGMFPEPSQLAAFALTAVVFLGFCCYVKRGRLAWNILGAGGAVFLAAVSTSSTALVAGLIIAAVIASTALVRWVIRDHLPVAAAILLPWVVVLAVAFGGPVWAYVSGSVDSKLLTTSFANRTTADAFSFDVFTQTALLGAGLGSNRPATFVPMLLSTVGIIGLILYVAFTIRVLWLATRHREALPAVWAVIALLISKSVAGPNLSEPWLWLGLAVVTWYAWAAPRPDTRPGTGTTARSDRYSRSLRG